MLVDRLLNTAKEFKHSEKQVNQSIPVIMNWIRLVLLMILHILTEKIGLSEIFQIRINKRAYEIAINLKYDGYQRTSASMVYRIFDKKNGLEAKGSANEEPAQELHKPVIKKYFVFYLGFLFTNIHKSQDCRGKGSAFL